MAVPWDQRPDFLRTSDWTLRPGGPTAYSFDSIIGQVTPGSPVLDPERLTGVGHNGRDVIDVTSFHPGQWDWSPENMPEILYMYKPPRERAAFKALRPSAPPPKYDAQGNTVYEKWPSDPANPRPLLDFPHLPDQIGTREWWWVFEAWRRYDPRITWKDIFMRQYRPNRKKSENTMQGLVSRARSSAMMVSWPRQPPQLTTANKKKADDKKAAQEAAKPNTDDHPDSDSEQNPHGKANDKTVRKPKNKSQDRSRDKSENQPDDKERDRVTELMTAAQIAANSTRGHTPGLINPSLGEIPGNRLPWPKRRRTAGQHQTTRLIGGASGGNDDNQTVELEASAAHQPSTYNSGSLRRTDDDTDERFGLEDAEGDTDDAEDDMPWVEDDTSSDISRYGYDEAIQEPILGRVQSTQGRRDMDNQAGSTTSTSSIPENFAEGPPFGTFRTSGASPSSSTPGAPTYPGANTSRQYVTTPNLPVPQYNSDDDLYGISDDEYTNPGGRTSQNPAALSNNPAEATPSSPFQADPLITAHPNTFHPAVTHETSTANNGVNVAAYASRAGLSPARWLELLNTLHAQGYGQINPSHQSALATAEAELSQGGTNRSAIRGNPGSHKHNDSTH
ncbi:MAG: hypothetical protein Q9213_002478 [Squamulea squamosa]